MNICPICNVEMMLIEDLADENSLKLSKAEEWPIVYWCPHCGTLKFYSLIHVPEVSKSEGRAAI